jgi:hypothetical protein
MLNRKKAQMFETNEEEKKSKKFHQKMKCVFRKEARYPLNGFTTRRSQSTPAVLLVEQVQILVIKATGSGSCQQIHWHLYCAYDSAGE